MKLEEQKFEPLSNERKESEHSNQDDAENSNSIVISEEDEEDSLIGDESVEEDWKVLEINEDIPDREAKINEFVKS